MERKLIDVSYHDGKIDWTQVKNHVDGAIIRCGYRRDMKNQEDKRFKENVKGCIENGIPFGVYLYSYATTLEEAKSEAEHALRLVEPYKQNLSYPVYYDLEEKGTEDRAVERAITFGNIIESKGHYCGIYANQNWWNTYLKDSLNRFTKWVAKYGANDGIPHEKPSISGTYDIWQYSSRGSVPGISGNVDMNICYRDLPGEIKGIKNESIQLALDPATVPVGIKTESVSVGIKTESVPVGIKTESVPVGIKTESAPVGVKTTSAPASTTVGMKMTPAPESTPSATPVGIKKSSTPVGIKE